MWPCLFVLLASWTSLAAALHALQPVALPTHHHHQRNLQDGDVTCELVNRSWLARLLAGHENFVQDLLDSGNDSRQRRRQQRHRRHRRNRRSLQQEDTSTLLLASVVPSEGTDSENYFDSARRPFLLDRAVGDRSKIQVWTEDGSKSAVLTDVQNKYVIQVKNVLNDNDSVVMASSLLTDETVQVQDFVAKTNFWAVAVSGKFRKVSGKTTRYQAFVVGVDDQNEDGSDANSITETSSSGLFLYVDKRTTKKSMKREKRDFLTADNDLSDGETLRALNLACLDPLQEIDNDCREQVTEEYRVKEAVLKEPIQASLLAMDGEVAQLNFQRFEDLYKIAAKCATQVGTPWNPRLVMDCIDLQKPRFYESFLVDFGSLLNGIEGKTVTRNMEVAKLKLGRNGDIRSACCAANTEENEDNRRQLRVLEQLDKRFPQQTTEGMTQLRPSHNKSNHTMVVLGNRRAYYASLLGNVTFNDETRSKSRQNQVRMQRSLQDASTSAATCQFIFQIDEEQAASLTEFPEDLYRTLTASAKTTSAPADAFVTKGYDTAETTTQELKFQRNSFTVQVRQAEVVELDVTELVKNRNGAPKTVRRYVRDGEFEAIVVEGSQAQEDGTEIEFVGVIFSRTDKNKQLMWPIDSGSLDVFTVRRGLQLVLERRRFRSLQRVDATAGAVECTATQSLDETCVVEAQEEFEELRSSALNAEATALDEIDEAIASANLERVDNVRFAGAECASELNGWNVTLLGQCLQDEKIPDITRAYLTRLLELNNAAVSVGRDTAAAIGRGRVGRDNALLECCEEAVTSSPSLSPSERPTFNPSETLSAGPTMRPMDGREEAVTLSPSLSPTERPTFNPSKTLSAGPTMRPMDARVEAVTSSPSLSPSERPTFNQSKTLSAGPTMRPMDGATVEPTMFPLETPTDKPAVAPTMSPLETTTENPSLSPSHRPSTSKLSPMPTPIPTVTPTIVTPSPSLPSDPTSKPTTGPSMGPSTSPSRRPTATPSFRPTSTPSSRPTTSPSSHPTTAPSFRPTTAPFSPTATPSFRPTSTPSSRPTMSPSSRPTTAPTFRPTTAPSFRPTVAPSFRPTTAPSFRPTTAPSFRPTFLPSPSPTASPSLSPINPTRSPSDAPTNSPSRSPVNPTPTRTPSNAPTSAPSSAPTRSPSQSPTAAPTSCSTFGQTTIDFDMTATGTLPINSFAGVAISAFRMGPIRIDAYVLSVETVMRHTLIVPMAGSNVVPNPSGGVLEFDFGTPGIQSFSVSYLLTSGVFEVQLRDKDDATLSHTFYSITGGSIRTEMLTGLTTEKVKTVFFVFSQTGHLVSFTYSNIQCS